MLMKFIRRKMIACLSACAAHSLRLLATLAFVDSLRHDLIETIVVVDRFHSAEGVSLFRPTRLFVFLREIQNRCSPYFISFHCIRATLAASVCALRTQRLLAA
jgi:hypothetical protein